MSDPPMAVMMCPDMYLELMSDEYLDRTFLHVLRCLILINGPLSELIINQFKPDK